MISFCVHDHSIYNYIYIYDHVNDQENEPQMRQETLSILPKQGWLHCANHHEACLSLLRLAVLKVGLLLAQEYPVEEVVFEVPLLRSMLNRIICPSKCGSKHKDHIYVNGIYDIIYIWSLCLFVQVASFVRLHKLQNILAGLHLPFGIGLHVVSQPYEQ